MAWAAVQTRHVQQLHNEEAATGQVLQKQTDSAEQRPTAPAQQDAISLCPLTHDADCSMAGVLGKINCYIDFPIKIKKQASLDCLEYHPRGRGWVCSQMKANVQTIS